MPTATLPIPAARADPEPFDDIEESLWRWSVDQYHEMIRVGLLDGENSVELLEGLLVTKMPKNPAHATAKRLIAEALRRILPQGWFLDDQDPITTSDSEPEPDIAVFRGSPRDYSSRHPGPADVALVVEVADSSLRKDRLRKKRVYARAAIPHYWIANLIDRQIEVFADPTGPNAEPDYQQQRIFAATTMMPVIVDTREIGRLVVADLLP